MRFELDDIIIDDIIFHMENQDGDFLFDSQEGCVIDLSFNEFDDEIDIKDERYIDLPHWGSNDGYYLMEKYILSLKNPVVRQELSNALNRKKGVFRAFRDVIAQYPETEKLWFKYKDQEMKNEVIAWYNALREEWGLEPIGIEPEDNTSLVLEDFVFKETNDYSFTVETADSESAGTINAVLIDAVLHINNLNVKPEYRGLGIGKTLLAKMLEKADENNLDVTIDLPEETNFFSRSLLLENFKPCMQKFIRKDIK